ncbi:MAG: hypothetical protein ABGX16_19395 [Pirellulales bacterium]
MTKFPDRLLDSQAPVEQDLSPLPHEEYIEQAHFFGMLLQRLRDNMPAQEVLASIREELLSTTKLPLAVDFLLTELRHQGAFAGGMRQLAHYFTPFQCYVMGEAENDRKQFDMWLALEILGCESAYRAEGISLQGLFLFQLEVLSRNRLGYDRGLEAISQDPSYDEPWREWILIVRRQIGIAELADLIYVRSLFYLQMQTNRQPRVESHDLELASEEKCENVDVELEAGSHLADSAHDSMDSPRRSTYLRTPSGSQALFGLQEGRIAWANRHKDQLLLFSALHRQLGYPRVPKPKPPTPQQHLLPALARRVEQLEARLKLVEQEQRGGIDLERFYAAPPDTEQSTEEE